jgi:hypothetical protein
MTAATEYTKAYNKFTGTGTVIARNIEKDRNIIVILESKDESKGQSTEPELRSVLLRGGVGKLTTIKEKYAEISTPPKYNWKVLGWYELLPANIEIPNQK